MDVSESSALAVVVEEKVDLLEKVQMVAVVEITVLVLVAVMVLQFVKQRVLHFH